MTNGRRRPIAGLPPRPRCVLVADADEKLRALLGGALLRHGFEAHLVPGGREALSLFRRCPGEFDLVVLEVLLPEMDGPQTLAALRAVNPAVPCCFLNGEGGDYTTMQLVGLGAVRVFDKPLCLADFTAALLEIVPR